MLTVRASKTILWDGTRDEFCHWLLWGSFSVWKKQLKNHNCSDKETEERLISYRNLVQCGKAQVKKSERSPMYFWDKTPLKGTPFRSLLFRISPIKTLDQEHLGNKTEEITCKADTWVIQYIPAAVALLNYIYTWLEKKITFISM